MLPGMIRPITEKKGKKKDKMSRQGSSENVDGPAYMKGDFARIRTQSTSSARPALSIISGPPDNEHTPPKPNERVESLPVGPLVLAQAEENILAHYWDGTVPLVTDDALVEALADPPVQVNISSQDPEAFKRRLATRTKFGTTFKDILIARGIALANLQHHTKAISVFAELAKVCQEDFEVLYALGTLYLLAGEAYEALPVLQKAVTLRPSHACALNNLAVALALQGHNEAAQHALEDAVKANPRYGALVECVNFADDRKV